MSGFGKTEVALRAAFVAAMSGTQVAVVVPTTLLRGAAALPHLPDAFRRTAAESRAALAPPFPAKQAAQTKKDLRRGQDRYRHRHVHALLAKGMAFRHLGLLIIDEEQHFGVTQKERLKQLKANVHVLTLTATPIPRTLQLALAGVREMSIIATPPVDRLAVRTFVLPFDPVVVRESGAARAASRRAMLLRRAARQRSSIEVQAQLKALASEAKIINRARPDGTDAARRGDDCLRCARANSMCCSRPTSSRAASIFRAP